MNDQQELRDRLGEEVGAAARAAGRSVAVAESLTGGMVAAAMAQAEGAARWFRGSLVAYASDVKHEVLRVPDGPVVSAGAARAMAAEVRKLLRADVAVAVTGAGGPAGQDGREPGTVFVAVDDGQSCDIVRHELGGDPAQVCHAAAVNALELIARRLRTAGAGEGTRNGA